jgi:phage replication-related protein YjqB (UPF0714/DUF867 family)
LSDFAELARRYKYGQDFEIDIRHADARVLILAPHGGKIEPGTSEVCRAIAGAEFTSYCLEGRLGSSNYDCLHVKSECFDEPQALKLASQARILVTVHGCDRRERELVYVGGRDTSLGERIARGLVQAGFVAEPAPIELKGIHPGNIVNRGRTGKGVQLEISRRLRDALMQDRKRLAAFAGAVRRAIRAWRTRQTEKEGGEVE